MNITRCANHSNSLVHLRRQWRRWQWHRRRRRWRGRRWQQRAPLRQRRTNRALRRWVRRGHRYLSQQGLQKYILFAYFILFLCTSLYCEFIAFLSYPARTRPLQQTCHSSSMAQQRNCKEPGSWMVSGWSLIGGEHPATTMTWLKSTRL